MENKKEFFKKITENIDRDNFHITVVQANENPRYAYTIGNLKDVDFELILAGSINYLYDDIIRIFNSIVPKISKGFKEESFVVDLQDLGVFKLKKIDDSWKKLMMLGVYDYYQIDNFTAYQIIPDIHHYTLDIPDLSTKWKSDDIIWKWLDDNIKWDLTVPQDSQVTVDLDILFGAKVTEVTRWEADQWEAFSQNPEDLDENNFRVIPIATLIGIDISTTPILKLDIEDGLVREDENSEWTEWN